MGIQHEGRTNTARQFRSRWHVLFILFVSFLAGCDHQTEPFDGPSLVDRFGEFALVEPLMASRDTVNFEAGESVHFTAAFNKKLPVILRITGQESGAVKEFAIFDNALNEENSRWNGTISELPLFRTEICTVELIIPEEDSLTFTTQVEVTGTRVFEGNVFTGFETPPGNNLFFGNFEFELSNNTGRKNDGTAGQGDWYYLFEGTDDVVPNFFVGLIDIKSSITGSTYAPIPTTVPEELFFNCFIRHDLRPFGIAVIQFVYDSNDSGAFEDGVDQTFQLDGDFPLNWQGWRHIYHTMADVGMSEEQVQKIVAIRVLLISDLNSQPSPPQQVGYGLDYLTFTSGRELQL